MKTFITGIALTLAVLAVPSYVGTFFGYSFLPSYVISISGSILLSVAAGLSKAINNQMNKA